MTDHDDQATDEPIERLLTEALVYRAGGPVGNGADLLTGSDVGPVLLRPRGGDTTEPPSGQPTALSVDDRLPAIEAAVMRGRDRRRRQFSVAAAAAVLLVLLATTLAIRVRNHGGDPSSVKAAASTEVTPTTEAPQVAAGPSGDLAPTPAGSTSTTGVQIAPGVGVGATTSITRPPNTVAPTTAPTTEPTPFDGPTTAPDAIRAVDLGSVHVPLSHSGRQARQAACWWAYPDLPVADATLVGGHAALTDGDGHPLDASIDLDINGRYADLTNDGVEEALTVVTCHANGHTVQSMAVFGLVDGAVAFLDSLQTVPASPAYADLAMYDVINSVAFYDPSVPFSNFERVGVSYGDTSLVLHPKTVMYEWSPEIGGFKDNECPC